MGSEGHQYLILAKQWKLSFNYPKTAPNEPLNGVPAPTLNYKMNTTLTVIFLCFSGTIYLISKQAAKHKKIGCVPCVLKLTAKLRGKKNVGLWEV